MYKLIDLLKEVRPYKGGKSKYTDDNIIAAAKKYGSAKELLDKDPGTYNAAKARGMLPDLRQYYTSGNKFYSNDDIRKLAQEYEYIEDFKDNHYNAYNTAMARGIWDDIKKGLKRREEYKPKDRLVYVYTFPEEVNEEGQTVKYAYVGLTAREEKRKGEHHSEKRKSISPVINHEKKSGHKATYEVLSKTPDNPSGYVGEDEARQQECDNMAKYRSEGWLLLNRRKCGGLGGGGRQLYSDEYLANIALKYTSKKEFNDLDRNAYSLAWTRGILDTITKHMPATTVDYVTNNFLCTICKRAEKQGKHLKAYDENAYAAARRIAKKQGIPVSEVIKNCLENNTITKSVNNKDVVSDKGIEDNDMEDIISPPVGNVK